MLMLSTVSSAEELFSGVMEKPGYADELWFWIPNDKRAEHYLLNFLTEFARSPKAMKQDLEVEFCGKGSVYEKIFKEAFSHNTYASHHLKDAPTMAILKVELGSIKSRKTDVAIYL